jgi:DhnA family fructose-bisphosphate aldolase class Ia
MNRLFAPDGHCLDVAVDHGFFGERAFLDSIEDMPEVVRTLVHAAPDAIQLSVGLSPLLQNLPGREKPALVLRTDIANIYGRSIPDVQFSRVIGAAVEQALRLDASCVVLNLFDLENQPDVRRQCIDNICLMKPECERMGMPLMIEPLVMKEATGSAGYASDTQLDKVAPLVRQAVELGADIIKADPTERVEDYHQIIRLAAGLPVLVRGGGRVPDVDIFSRTKALMAQGAKGIVYGRNIIQHPNPAGMTRALMAIVHQGISVDDALALVAERAS